MSLLRRIEKGSGGSNMGGGDQGGSSSDMENDFDDPNDESKLAAMRQRRQAISEQQRPGAQRKQLPRPQNSCSEQTAIGTRPSINGYYPQE